MINNERSARLKQKSAAVENFSAWCKFATLVQALLAVISVFWLELVVYGIVRDRSARRQMQTA